MRLALLLSVVLAFAPAVLAQGNETNATNQTGETPAGSANATQNQTAPAGPLEISLEGYQENGAFWWQLAGQSQHNPTITVAPGQQVIFHVKSASGLHNLAVGDQAASKVIPEGDQLDYAWTAPTTPGSVVYICKIHGAVMSGKVQVGEAEPAGGGGQQGGEVSGDAVDLGTLGHPECAGYKIPAIATRHVTGGPTVDDYVKACKSGGASTASARPAHPADYVIPISFALIGLGVVGVVWAHRFYKP